MQLLVSLRCADVENDKNRYDLNSVPDFLKEYPTGVFRSPFFSSDEKSGLFGPMIITFAIRRAKDLLVEGCEYAGIDIQLEVDGKCLPQLPTINELNKILNREDCIIRVNGQAFKPSTEVFGFQQVYDDSVKCIEALKRLGIPQNVMAIYATPDEITLEIHGGAINLEGTKDLDKMYYRLLTYIAEIKDTGTKLQKTSVKTVILDSYEQGSQVLLPGSNHPTMRRPKVSVGPSHFAYGIAAFSDFCGKKRTQEECLQEAISWVKFVQTETSPVAELADKIIEMPLIASVNARTQVTSEGNTVVSNRGFSSHFQSFKSKLEGSSQQFETLPDAVSSGFNRLNMSLGGGWASSGLHLIIGSRESGKASFLMQQAFLAEKSMPVLYISYEQDLRELSLRSAAKIRLINYSDLISQITNEGDLGKNALKVLSGALNKVKESISENLFFSGIETNRNEFLPEKIQQLASMIPGNENKLILLESVPAKVLNNNNGNLSDYLRELRTIAIENRLTILMSIHSEQTLPKRPHFIENTDRAILEDYQPFCDSLLVTHTERANLRRFVAMMKGEIDAQVVADLEQKSLQLSEGKRLRSDTYMLLRLLHSRRGRRDILLYLSQPDLIRIIEVASIPMTRP